VSSPAPLPLFFRSTVLVGCAALLLGVAGIFYFHGRDETRRSHHPSDATIVAVQGLLSVEGIRLRATWLDLAGTEQAETGKPGFEAGVWLFRRAPEGIALTLEVLQYADGTRRLLHSQPAVLTRGALLEVWLPGER